MCTHIIVQQLRQDLPRTGPNIYLGCTDNQVLRYALEGNSDGVSLPVL